MAAIPPPLAPPAYPPPRQIRRLVDCARCTDPCPQSNDGLCCKCRSYINRRERDHGRRDQMQKYRNRLIRLQERRRDAQLSVQLLRRSANVDALRKDTQALRSKITAEDRERLRALLDDEDEDDDDDDEDEDDLDEDVDGLNVND